MLYDEVDAAEVVGRLDDVVDADRLIGDADGIGLVDVARLLLRETTSLDVVGVVGKVYLRPMVDAPSHLALHLLSQSKQQRRVLRLGRQGGICRDTPCLPLLLGARQLPLGTVTSHGLNCQTMIGGILFLRDKSHIHPLLFLCKCISNSLLLWKG